MDQSIKGNLVDISNRRIYAVRLEISASGNVEKITPLAEIDPFLPFLLPGFIDSHVHVESSMLVPSEFARLAVTHGTVASVSDPHEIANVCGMEGVEFMITNGKKTPFKFYFGAPSCVPATGYETAGASLDAAAVGALLQNQDIKYLSEMMNFPGVLQHDPQVMQKIAAAKALGKPVDGHAPGLRGSEAKQYIQAGISTDHECYGAEEALEKLQLGMKILIREGSAARNFEALIGLLNDHPDKIMFCSDDKHPDSLVTGHINQLCARAVAKGIDLFKVLRAACINPVLHYKLEVGMLQQGDAADFIMVKDLKKFEVIRTYINGKLVAENGKSLIPPVSTLPINQFACKPKLPADFQVPADPGDGFFQCIEALDGQLITNKLKLPKSALKLVSGHYHSNPQADLLKIVVVNRYKDAPVAKAFIKNFGLLRGAIASSVAHDSHNIVAVGADDDSLSLAVNRVIEARGGISVAYPDVDGRISSQLLALPVAGLMSAEDGYLVAEKYTAMDAKAKYLGSGLSAPFMTLSFMALLVIPHLKLSDKGLFDADQFSLV